MKILIFLLVAFLGATLAQVEPYGSNICRLFADGVKLRNPGKCDSYITCKNGVEVITECKGKFFNKETGKCVTRAPDAYCKDPCTKKSPFWETDPKSCNGFFKCPGNSPGEQDYCPDGLHFDFKGQACIYESDSNCKGFNLCDVVPNNVPFKNENHCQKYYTCVKNKLTENVCQKMYYDVQKGCTKKSEVDCPNHQIPIGICGTPKRPAQDKYVNDELTCNGYYYCHDVGDNIVDTLPRFGVCPEGLFFNSKLQGCMKAEDVKCDEDRCAGMSVGNAVSSEEGCQHYLVCKNGVTVSKESCPNGMFFDASSGECSEKVHTYAACS